MEAIKIKIKPLSAFKSKLQSDTIFGIFSWGYRFTFGEEKLQKLLENYDKNPSIIFSDGFLEDTLARPVLKPLRSEIIEEIIKKYTKDNESVYSIIKTLKKINSIDIEELLPLLHNSALNEKEIINSLLESLFDTKGNFITPEKRIYSHHILKNSVNRIKNTTTEGLYVSEETYYNSNIEIYVKFRKEKISIEEIEKVFANIGITGFGADKSTGKGRFKIISIDEDFEIKDYLIPAKNRDKNGFISLSSGLVINDKIKLNFGKTFTKFGKLGGDKAYSGNHFKNPVILFQPGSTFFINEYKEFYGNATDKVFIDKRGFHSGYMIPLFVKL